MSDPDESGRARGITRRTGLAAAVTALGVAAVGATAAVLGRPRAASQAAPVSAGTAVVTRGTVAQRLRFTGALGYEGGLTVAHQGAPGILTAAAEVGSTVSRGGILYSVANQPVRLLYGTTPSYRDLTAAVPAGPDVKQLEENLVAMGMDPGRQIVVDGRFTAATTAAVRRWQASWGVPVGQRTGKLAQGTLVFAPDALRIGQLQATVGGAVGPGEAVLKTTSTTRVVTADVPAIRESSVHVGDQVQVTVNGVNGQITGKVLRVGRVATAPAAQQGQTGAATVTVTIQIALPAGSADLDQAPAGVFITTDSRQNVLLVPVVALLARTGGGYQVRLSSGAFVEVKPGLFDEVAGLVEVVGDLTVGQQVQVPAA